MGWAENFSQKTQHGKMKSARSDKNIASQLTGEHMANSNNGAMMEVKSIQYIKEIWIILK